MGVKIKLPRDIEKPVMRGSAGHRWAVYAHPAATMERYDHWRFADYWCAALNGHNYGHLRMQK